MHGLRRVRKQLPKYYTGFLMKEGGGNTYSRGVA